MIATILLGAAACYVGLMLGLASSDEAFYQRHKSNPKAWR